MINKMSNFNTFIIILNKKIKINKYIIIERSK